MALNVLAASCWRCLLYVDVREQKIAAWHKADTTNLSPNDSQKLRFIHSFHSHSLIFLPPSRSVNSLHLSLIFLTFVTINPTSFSSALQNHQHHRKLLLHQRAHTPSISLFPRLSGKEAKPYLVLFLFYRNHNFLLHNSFPLSPSVISPWGMFWFLFILRSCLPTALSFSLLRLFLSFALFLWSLAFLSTFQCFSMCRNSAWCYSVISNDPLRPLLIYFLFASSRCFHHLLGDLCVWTLNPSLTFQCALFERRTSMSCWKYAGWLFKAGVSSHTHVHTESDIN